MVVALVGMDFLVIVEPTDVRINKSSPPIIANLPLEDDTGPLEYTL